MTVNVIGSPPRWRLFFVPLFASNDVTECLTCKFTLNQEGRVIDFDNLLLYSPKTLPLGILEKLKFCYNQKNKKSETPS